MKLISHCLFTGTLHQASINHKLIMLHQSFLSKSFKDVRYTYTRWACATSAKTVIQLYKTRDPDEPQWWVEQAFVVTSAICLMLDLFNRPPTDTEVDDYLGNVQHAVRFLQQFTTSSVALHGVRLLLSLLQEYNNLHEGARPQPAAAKCNDTMSGDTVEQDQGMYRAIDGQCLPSNPEVPLSNEETAQFNFDIDTIPFEDIMDWLPLEGGLDNNVFFDSISGLSGGQFL
jgi:transcription elongation factor SPT5